MRLLLEGNKSTFTDYFSLSGLRWCCGSCHLLCPPVPLMLPLALTHHRHVSHPRCPSTMRTQTSYSFHPKDEAESHHVSSLECRRANGGRGKRRGSQSPDPSSFRICRVKDSHAKGSHRLPLVLACQKKSILRHFQCEKAAQCIFVPKEVFNTWTSFSAQQVKGFTPWRGAEQHFLFFILCPSFL